ncbi:hypothetical protein AAG906_016167 [Vitis piasezkii]
MIGTQYNAKVWVMRSDNGGEYQSSDHQKYLKGHDIIHQTICSNTPQKMESLNEKIDTYSMYFSFESGLQGEYHKEIQNLDYDYHISEEDESGQSELVNQEAGELDMSGTTLEPSSNDHPEAEEVIEEGRDNTIEPSPPSEQFGFEDSFTEMPNQSSSLRLFVNQLSTVAIPNSVQEALADPRWKATMNEEMKSL